MTEQERLLHEVLECETCHDKEGHAYLKVPARSIHDLGARIRAALAVPTGSTPRKLLIDAVAGAFLDDQEALTQWQDDLVVKIVDAIEVARASSPVVEEKCPICGGELGFSPARLDEGDWFFKHSQFPQLMLERLEHLRQLAEVKGKNG